jgi:hypothetical protein
MKTEWNKPEWVKRPYGSECPSEINFVTEYELFYCKEMADWAKRQYGEDAVKQIGESLWEYRRMNEQ